MVALSWYPVVVVFWCLKMTLGGDEMVLLGMLQMVVLSLCMTVAIGFA